MVANRVGECQRKCVDGRDSSPEGTKHETEGAVVDAGVHVHAAAHAAED